MASRYGRGDFPSFEEEHVYRPQPTMTGAPTRALSSLFALAAVFAIAILSAVFWWMGDGETAITRSITQATLVVFTLAYILYGAFALYHGLRFGFRGDANRILAVVFIVVSVVGFAIAFRFF